MSKTLIVLTFSSIIAQIIFSFYYSSNIVNHNNQLDEYQQKYQELTLDIANTKKQLTALTSINHFLESTPSANFYLNTKSINLSNF